MDTSKKYVKQLGVWHNLHVTMNPWLKDNKIQPSAHLNGTLYVSSNWEDDMISFMKGEEVTNDALLAALAAVNEDEGTGTSINPAFELQVENEVNLPPVDFAPTEQDFPEFDYEDDVPEFAEPTKTKKKEKKAKTKTFKADKMANGFVFQANPLSDEKEPFYMEAYLLGNNEIYISGGMAGLLNGDEAKQLRKQLKMLLNQLKQSYPDPDPEKGGKATVKVDAPWIPTEDQLSTLKLIVEKDVKKHFEDENTEPDEVTMKLVQNIAYQAAVTAVSQLSYEPHTNEAHAEPELATAGAVPDANDWAASFAEYLKSKTAPAIQYTSKPSNTVTLYEDDEEVS